MAKNRKKSLTRDELASLIEKAAAEIEKSNKSFSVQQLLTTAQVGLAELHDLDGLKIVSRLSMVLMDGEKHYAIVQKAIDALAPLNPAEDGAALKSLAARLRTAN
jgi:hypothetical protein